MNTIKLNNKVISVPDKTIIHYLKYRKIIKQPYYFAMEETLNMYVQNIMIWANDINKLNTTFAELEQELEKIALELI